MCVYVCVCVADAVLRGPAKRQAIGCGLLARLIAHTSLIADAQSAFAATVVPAALHLLKENLANSRARPLKNTLAADSGVCHSHDDCCRSCLLCWGFPDRRGLTHMRACVRVCVCVCVAVFICVCQVCTPRWLCALPHGVCCSSHRRCSCRNSAASSVQSCAHRRRCSCTLSAIPQCAIFVCV